MRGEQRWAAREAAILHHHHHAWTYVLLSLAVAVFGSWTALDLARRVTTHVGRGRLAWVSTAAIAMGLSIWSMHFIAMLSFDPGSAVSYDLALTTLSLALAIGSTWSAFVVATRDHAGGATLYLAGTAMGAGICLMHYVGMAAVRTAQALGYRADLVIVSVVIAVVASTAALMVARRSRGPVVQALAALLLGAAVVGMHFTAMAALASRAAMISAWLKPRLISSVSRDETATSSGRTWGNLFALRKLAQAPAKAAAAS